MSSRQQGLKQVQSRSILLCALAPVIGSFLLVGCDTPQHSEDKKITQQVSDAQRDLQMHEEASDLAARKSLEGAASATVSPMTVVYVKSTLGQVELDAANDAMRRVDRDELKMAELVYEISQLASQVDSSHAMAAVYSKYDPAQAKAAIAQRIADAQGGADKLEWCKSDGATIPTLAAVKQTISKLEGDIAKKKDETKTLEDQRTHTLDEAEQASKNAVASKGQQSVDAFKQASELRKQAGMISIQIDRAKADTVPMEKDLAVAQGQQGVLEEAIKQLQDESDALDKNWAELQSTVSSQSTLAQQIVGSGTAPAGAAAAKSVVPASVAAPITTKVTALAQLADDLQSERQEADTNLNNAIKHFGDAVTAAQQVSSDITSKISTVTNQERPDVVAGKSLQTILNPMAYTLQVGTANRMLGDLRTSEINSMNNRQQMIAQVTKSLTAAGIAVPADLADKTPEEIKKSLPSLASEAYGDAETKIGSVKDGNAPPALKDVAAVQHVLLLYGQAQLARATGNTKDVATNIQAAKTERDAILQNNSTAIMPTLPSELAAPATPTPSTPVTPGTPAAKTPATPG